MIDLSTLKSLIDQADAELDKLFRQVTLDGDLNGDDKKQLRGYIINATDDLGALRGDYDRMQQRIAELAQE
jgi:cytochrome oxidase Cu insertion factor (SCO1/SenC/PrrC family)